MERRGAVARVLEWDLLMHQSVSLASFHMRLAQDSLAETAMKFAAVPEPRVRFSPSCTTAESVHKSAADRAGLPGVEPSAHQRLAHG